MPTTCSRKLAGIERREAKNSKALLLFFEGERRGGEAARGGA